MPPLSPRGAQALREEQLRRRSALVASELEHDEPILDHSIARLDRTANGAGFKIEGFIVATDQKVVFHGTSFIRTIRHDEVASVRVKRRFVTRELSLRLNDGELVEFNVGKTFARSLKKIIRSAH